MKYLIAALLLIGSCVTAAAQGCGPSNPNCIVPTAPPGTSDNRAASTAFVQSSASGSAVKGPASSTVGDVPSWNNTTGTLLSDPANITSNSQDFYFGSGRPWCDVRAKGAKGNGSTDDSAAFSSCVTTLTGTGGILYVPPGDYVVTSGVSITGAVPVSIVCASRGTEIQTGSADVVLITLNNAAHEIHECTLQGASVINTIHDAIVLQSSCVGCKLEGDYIVGGRHAINNAAADVDISYLFANGAYGSSILYNTGAGSCHRCKMDQGYPVSTPPGSSVFPAWAATTSYSAGTVVSTGGYYIQAINSGTSGGSAPTLQPYGTYITDNITGSCPSPSAGVCWYLVGATTYAAAQMDTGASTFVFDDRSDLSGSYTYGLYLSNTLSGTAPSQTIFTDSFASSAYVANIYQAAGNGLTVKGAQVTSCLGSNCYGIYLHAAGDDQIIASTLFGNPFGIVMDAGKNYMIVGNNIFSATQAGVYLGGSVTNASVTANVVGNSTAWGTNAIGIDVAGSNDYYEILGNICHGATTCFSDAALGAHRTVDVPTGTVIASAAIYGGGAPSYAGTVPYNFHTGTNQNVTINPHSVLSSGIQMQSVNDAGNALEGWEVAATNFSVSSGPLTLGVSGTLAGTVVFNNATSGTITLGPATGALNSNTLTLPNTAGNDTIAVLGNFAAPPAIGNTTPAAGTFTTLTATGQIVGNMANTIASATAATLDDLKVQAATTTITGNTGSPITALSKYHIQQPTLTDSSSVTVTQANTLLIDNAPAAAGSVTITNGYALNVAAGQSLLGGKVFMSGLTAGSGTKALCLNATANEVQTDTSATICGISALRYKNLISEITPDQGLAVLSLRGETYRYKPDADQDDKIHVSLIADDMAALNPACANYSPHGVENYMDRCFEAYQVAYDKKLWQIIGELRNEIADLRRGR